MGSKSKGGGRPLLGVDGPFQMATLTPKKIRMWARMAIYIVRSNMERQKRGNLWNSIRPGVQATVGDRRGVADKPDIEFKYPGTTAQQFAFATETTTVAICKRADWQEKWLEKLGE